MTEIAAIIGWLLLLATAADIANTTVSSNRMGPLTRASAAAFWRLVRALPVPRLAALRRATGPAVMTVVGATWLLLTSLAWLLIFRADPSALQVKATGDPATWAESYSFVSSALSTMGASKIEATSTGWEILAMAAAVNGMIVLTLSVSFVLNITQTVTSGRAFHILTASVDTADSSNIGLLLPELAQICARVRAAPLALYYATAHEDRSLPVTLAGFARSVAANRQTFEAYRGALAQLPYLDASPDDGPERFADRLEEWAESFTLRHDR